MFEETVISGLCDNKKTLYGVSFMYQKLCTILQLSTTLC